MDIGKMNAEQVARALAEVDGGFEVLDSELDRELLLRREEKLRARELIVGKPLRGVSLDLALAGDRDSLRQAIQHALASLESGQLDSSRLHEALRRSDELGAKWEPREVEAVTVALQNEGLRFELTVAHGALRRLVETRAAYDKLSSLPVSDASVCAAWDAFKVALSAAKEIAP